MLQEWEPFPPNVTFNDFGGVGLMQTPTARFAPDGQVTLGANHVQPYDRYFFTVHGLPWVEATLRLTTVRNRLYSDTPDFSGTQSYKDRGFDLKLKLIEEGAWRPAVAFGLRDFIGTNLFSSEYFVMNKNVGPLDISLGVGWGNMATRGVLPNPFRALSSRFDTRGRFTAGGGAPSSAYFKGRNVGLFGGIKYDTPIRGLTLKAELDPNDYKAEALSNRFRAPSPVNVGFDYALRSWLHLGAAFERGNKVGLNLALTTNFNRPFSIPKFDPPGAVLPEARPEEPTAQQTLPDLDADVANMGSLQPLSRISSSDPPAVLASDVPAPPTAETKALADALGVQGAGIYAADFRAREVTIYVAQSRFSKMALGLGRMARAAYSVLPDRYQAVTFVFVEGGLQTIAVQVYRSDFLKSIDPKRGSPEELYNRTKFSVAPLAMSDANFVGDLSKVPPRFFYSIRPTLKTTLGRPEQFILYQAGVRLNGFLDIRRGLNVQGSLAFNISDNFDKLRIPSDSQLPHVRSDIKEYLREGKTSLPALHANYSFNIAPALYGHIYGGLLEEMFGGVGGEILYRRATTNWALGADLSYVKQRDFDQRFGFRDYSVLTGFVTGAYHFPAQSIDVRVRLGRYLAKDYGGTIEISRTFDSGVTIGAFATKTNVSAAEFGEGRFDKGIYLTLPIDAIYNRHVRGSVGIAYRPLIRDGGQMLRIPQPLLVGTDDSIKAKFLRNWDEIND